MLIYPLFSNFKNLAEGLIIIDCIYNLYLNNVHLFGTCTAARGPGYLEKRSQMACPEWHGLKNWSQIALQNAAL